MPQAPTGSVSPVKPHLPPPFHIFRGPNSAKAAPWVDGALFQLCAFMGALPFLGKAGVFLCFPGELKLEDLDDVPSVPASLL